MELLNITKFDIIKKSGCLSRAITSLLFSSISFAICLAMLGLKINWITELFGALLMFFALFLVAALVSNLIIIVQIMKGQYRIEISTVHAIKSRNKYSPAYDKQKALVLDDVRIVVSEIKSKQFHKGDDVVIVYLSGKEYPIIIERKNVFHDHMMNQNK